MSVLVHLLTLLHIDLSILNDLIFYLSITGYYYIDLFVTVVLPLVTYLNKKKFQTAKRFTQKTF
jgi:hypothetical protein